MENASNALIMAAGILISVMIISLGTFLFATFGNYSKQINNNLSQTQKDEFNSQFTKYEGQECTPHDVVTIINLAKDINEKNGYTNGQALYINVTATGNNIKVLESSEISKLNAFINRNTYDNGTLTKFSCTVTIDENVGLVTGVYFTQN